jgi:Zn-dependent protease
MFIQINLFLAVFNLLPIPPFDGSHIVEGCCLRAAQLYARFRRLAFRWCWFCWCCCRRWCLVSIHRTLRRAAFAWLYGHVMRLRWIGGF